MSTAHGIAGPSADGVVGHRRTGGGAEVSHGAERRERRPPRTSMLILHVQGGRETGAQDQPAARRRSPPWPLTWARPAQVEDGGCDNKDADLVVFAGDVLVYPAATPA